MDKKRMMRARYVYHGFGFPVTLCHVPLLKIRGAWTPDVDYERLQRALLSALAGNPARLSGHEIRFIRLSFDMTLQAFAGRFAVTHPAVLKWEAARHSATGMAWATEKDIRLFVVSKTQERPARFLDRYRELEVQPKAGRCPLKIDVSSVA